MKSFENEILWLMYEFELAEEYQVVSTTSAEIKRENVKLDCDYHFGTKFWMPI